MKIKKESKIKKKANRALKKYLKQEGLCPLCRLSLYNEFIKLIEWYDNRVLNKQKLVKRNKLNINYDHIVPVSKGGKDSKSNKQLTHATCNSKKGNELSTPSPLAIFNMQ